jgi:oligopeptide/dipeptide ABC transporter ATP-binding protein
MMNDKPLLKIEDLVLHFRTNKGSVQAVDKVNLELGYNEAVVILGESGCGKSSFAKAVLRMLPKNVQSYSGRVFLHDNNIMTLSDEDFRKNVRWNMMSMVPQAAMNALNPVLRIGEQVGEPFMVHSGGTKKESLMKASKMFEHVGVPQEFLHRYAFELSGGMRQRAAIAMALVTSPDLIILDEPTSALDVLTQANIFNVLKTLKRELQMSYILITHDIATSSELADKVAVMYAGQIVEVSDASRFFVQALHPYSRKLMDSVPRLRGDKEPDFITGQPPSLLDLPSGCRFKDRCPSRFSACEKEPALLKHDGRLVKCWLYQ